MLYEYDSAASLNLNRFCVYRPLDAAAVLFGLGGSWAITDRPYMVRWWIFTHPVGATLAVVPVCGLHRMAMVRTKFPYPP